MGKFLQFVFLANFRLTPHPDPLPARFGGA